MRSGQGQEEQRLDGQTDAASDADESPKKKVVSTRDEVRIRRSSIGGTRCLCGTKARGSYN